jgi:hypothetical protein
VFQVMKTNEIDARGMTKHAQRQAAKLTEVLEW